MEYSFSLGSENDKPPFQRRRLPSRPQPLPPDSSIPRAIGSLLVVTVIVGIISAAAGGGDATLVAKRFALYTNVLFAWPAVHALAVGADAESLVFLATLVISMLHHGCLYDDVCRRAVAVEVFVLLGLTLLGIIVGAGVVLCARAHRPQMRTCLGAGLVLVAIAVVVVGAVALGHAPMHLDGCLYYHADAADTSYVAPLVTLWSSVDVVTALAALVAVLVFLVHVGRALELGLVWLFAVLTLVLVLWRDAGYVTTTTLYVVLGLVLVVFVLVRGLACVALPRERRERLTGSYNICDVVGGVLVGASALVLFLVFNDTADAIFVHGLWHVLAAVALVLVVDARGRFDTINDYRNARVRV